MKIAFRQIKFNQAYVYCKNFVYFASYNKIIARQDLKTMKYTFDEIYWNYSATTSKYRNQFTGYSTKETESKIKSGEIKLTNLN